MAKITSLVARVGGIVAYADNTNAVFHAQCDDNQRWTIDQAESLESHKQIAWYWNPVTHWPFWDAYEIVINSLNLFLFNFNWNSGYPTIQKAVRDMTMRAEILFTTDDQQIHSTGAVYENGRIVHVSYSGARPSNHTVLESKILQMFQLVIDQVMVLPRP